MPDVVGGAENVILAARHPGWITKRWHLAPQHFRYIRSGGTVNIAFPRILCRFFSYSPLMLCSLTQLPENCMEYHRASTDLHSKSVIPRVSATGVKLEGVAR
ncbi:hypothetical protein T11_7248 [Trichinella zimbabwensis]|uniref:Uncharacterized protein n=1 Tax=Trichinella zimbabwensis TaxID=268475 RepID=A0A0V1GQG5_9BILA|nr:hypothetical protein T11_7248 [Trichinella zimbabwensis]